MEMVLAIVTGVAATGVVVQGVASYFLTYRILARRESLHRNQVAEREKIHREEREAQGTLYILERDRQNKRLEVLDKRLADQEVYHQTERRELYERIQSMPVYTEPLLTGRGGSGTNKGRSAAVDLDDMPLEELAKIGVLANSDGGFIDLWSKDKDLFETVKGLLFFREETEKEKKDLAADI